jgi:hypothetical protein
MSRTSKIEERLAAIERQLPLISQQASVPGTVAMLEQKVRDLQRHLDAHVVSTPPNPWWKYTVAPSHVHDAIPPRWSYKQMKDAGEQLVQAVLNGDGFFQAMDNFYEKNLIPHTVIVPLWFCNEYRKRCVVNGSDTFWRATKLIPAGSDEDKSLFCNGGKW